MDLKRNSQPCVNKAVYLCLDYVYISRLSCLGWFHILVVFSAGVVDARQVNNKRLDLFWPEREYMEGF